LIQTLQHNQDTGKEETTISKRKSHYTAESSQYAAMDSEYEVQKLPDFMLGHTRQSITKPNIWYRHYFAFGFNL
jgi:hypothetical protein